MNISTFNYFMGIGTLFILILTATVIIMRVAFGKESTLIKKIVIYALPVGFIFSFLAIAGSLTYSEIYALPPCLFCWWQRVFIYPQVILFAVAWYRSEKNYNESSIFYYSLPLSIIATLTSVYHMLLERGVLSPGGACVANGTSCAIVSTQVFGFITIPVMAFTIGITLVLLGYLVLTDKKTP
jgi:disulfide bond formation protein DsbB